ncbi:kinesin-like protein KIF18A isoform X2 [Anoplophora glabripennis]|uniref:kinesin-like protein KIF18A isoform X2 n=1 Tax=Anoplophora glabripennis TaxID=217634 RepID=UPI000875427D|nr:kinesin-like protein KIF18A isoform X2 [Anoplophora glabripennis]
MVKSKRDLNTPRRRDSLTKNRAIARTVSRPTSAAVQVAAVQPVVPNIRVVVRVRPPNEKEQGENCRMVVKVVDDQMLIFDPKEDAQAFFFHGVQQRGRDLLKKSHKDMQFMFDKVFSKDSNNEDVFQNSTHSLINSLMDGYNCSVFAYGATGAGKTHTMTGKPETPGITFLTMTELFRKRDELTIEREFELGITYLEVYNELVKDLLNPGSPLQLREDGKYGVMVAGIKVHKIQKPEELFSLLDYGNKNRTQHPTDANAESSRSHAVFQVYLHMTIKGTGEVQTAKLSMIDLAGSERGSATGYVGARFTEGANINKSLLALGNCINSLADGQRHVPYRDSKLTRLLKDSLGGNCQTVMIANVSPSSLSFEDTYNTLKYATRAKKIKANIKRNVVNVELHVGHYVKMVEDLQKENSSLKIQLNDEKSKNCCNEALQSEFDKLKAQVDNICVQGGRIVDEELKDTVKSLVQEKKDVLERQFQLLKSEMGTNLRRRIKEEIDARLSDVCTNTPEKKEAHRKISNMVDRFKKQETAIKGDIALTETTRLEVDKKIDDLVKEHPELETFVELETKKLEIFALEQQLEIEQRQSSLLMEDHTEKCTLLEKMAAFVKPCYLTLKGHGFVTSTLTKQYQEIVLDYQGRKNIKWAQIPDSGIGSSSTLGDGEETKSNNNKRKIDEPAVGTTLDSTFTMSINLTPNKPKAKMCAEQLMSKVFKPPPAKRLVSGLSPRSPRAKDKALRRPFGAIDSTRTVLSAKTGTKLTTAQKSLADRPRFRS